VRARERQSGKTARLGCPCPDAFGKDPAQFPRRTVRYIRVAGGDRRPHGAFQSGIGKRE